MARDLLEVARMSKAAILVLILAGCGDGAGGLERTEVQGVYGHELVPPGECPEDGLFNCSADLELCADGSATLLVTDIINGGAWSIDSGHVVFAASGPADVPSPIRFAIDGDALVDDWQGWAWTRVESAYSLCPSAE